MGGSVAIPSQNQVDFKDFYTKVTTTYREKGGWSPTYNCQVLSHKTMMEATNAPMSPYEDATDVDYITETSETMWTISVKWAMCAFALWSIFKFVRWVYRQCTKDGMS